MLVFPIEPQIKFKKSHSQQVRCRWQLTETSLFVLHLSPVILNPLRLSVVWCLLPNLFCPPHEPPAFRLISLPSPLNRFPLKTMVCCFILVSVDGLVSWLACHCRMSTLGEKKTKQPLFICVWSLASAGALLCCLLMVPGGRRHSCVC